MASTEEAVRAQQGTLQELAKRHLWMHFTRMSAYQDGEVPIIVRGEGCYVFDEHGNRYLDGLSALFCVNIGHGRGDIAQAGADQAKDLGFFTNWSYAHPMAIELAKRDRVATATALSPLGFHNSREAVYQRVSLATTVKLARLLAPHADRLTRSPAVRRLTWSQIVARPELVPPADAAAATKALAAAPWFDDNLHTLVKERFVGGEHISVPVTIAWGEKDRLLLPRQAQRAARRVPGGRMVILTGCGHVPTYDDPPQVARVLLDGSRQTAGKQARELAADQTPTGAATDSGTS